MGHAQGPGVPVGRLGGCARPHDHARVPGQHEPELHEFTLAFTATTGNGIRLFGAPGGANDFFSIAELEVYDSGDTNPPPPPPPPPPTNVAPVANAGADQTVTSGQTVTLNGSASSDANGDAITYQWTQVAQAGVPTVTLSSATAVAPSFTAPTVTSSTVITFNLVVRDVALLASVADSVAITVNPPAPPPPPPSGSNLALVGTPIISVTAPTGGGNRNLGIIKDGVKPAPGTNNDWTQYDTYTGQLTTSGWVGYTFTSTYTLNQVVFYEGMHYGDGGWWDTLTVQALQNGTWVPVTGLSIAPAYPFSNNGISYQSFTLGFTPIAATGVRLFGQPGGSADFFSIAELEVYGTSEPPPPPPPNTAPTANAGADQSVVSGQTVTLNGTGSSDPQGTAGLVCLVAGDCGRRSDRDALERDRGAADLRRAERHQRDRADVPADRE